MAYTNEQLVRMLVGDVGLYARDVTDGDGASTEFYLTTPPALGASAAVYVDGVLKTETTEYTLDDESGRLLLQTAPSADTGNLVVLYRAVQIPDSQVQEACRQYALTPTTTADTGLPEAAIRAAIMLCESMAGQYASVGSVALGGGGSLGQGGVSDAWARRADDLRSRLNSKSGLTSQPVTRVDGYSDDRKATDVNITGTNPRRRYYGEPDRIP